MSGLRPPDESDLAEVVSLMSRHWPEAIDEDSVRRGWTHPGVVLELDARLGPDCYGMVESFGDSRVWLDLRGEPSDELLDWAESRGRELGTRILSGAWSTHELLLRELERRAFGLVRHSHRMEIDLAEPTAEPSWPDDIELRTYREGDDRVFYDLEIETFADSWEPAEETFEEWSHWMLEPPAFVPELWFLATAHDEPAGFAICHPHPARGELGWVRMLGVRRPWRRRGLGRALLLHAFSELCGRGFGRVGLGVDAESLTGANVLYERAGMHVVARFDIYEKPAQ
jgi:ribosomal protein S18 acetylase RimI-like enzyme